MKYLNQYRAAFIKKDGTWEYYPSTIGFNHQQIIEEFCKKEGHHYPSIDTIIKNQNIIFYNAGNGMFLSFLPKKLTEEQYYSLDLFSLFMNDISYLEVRKEGQKEDFIITKDIGKSFSDIIIQSYFEENQIEQKISK